MSQEQADAMVAKGLSFDPTFTRYSVPSMDDDDDKHTGGKYRMIPLVTKAISMAVATKGLPIMIGSGADGGPYPHGAAQAIEFEALVKRAGMSPARAIQSGNHGQRHGDGLAGPDWIDREWQVCRHGRSLRRSADGYHRAAACEVSDEGRPDHPR